MHTEVRDTQPRADALSCRAKPNRPFSERLVIAALVTVVNLWIGLAEVIPDTRGRA